MPLEITITNTQKVKVTLAPVTGETPPRPAPVDGPPTWERVSGNSTFHVADDGLSADLISADDPGDSEFIVRADADLGSGVEEISDMIRLTVQGAHAQSLGLVAGTPESK